MCSMSCEMRKPYAVQDIVILESVDRPSVNVSISEEAMNWPRREVLKRAGVAGVAYLIPSRGSASFADELNMRKGGWKERLSSAVVEDAISAMVVVINQGRSIDYGDAEVAVYAVKMMQDHFDEIGLSAAIDHEVRHSRKKLLNLAPSDDVVQEMTRQVTRRGLVISPDQVRDMLSIPQERKVQALDKLRAEGFAAVGAEAIERAHQFAEHLKPGYVGFGALNPCDEIRIILDTLYFLAALYGLACALGCVPVCCIIAAAIVVEARLIQLLFDEFC